MKLFMLAAGARDRASSRLRVWDHVAWFRARGDAVRADSVAKSGVKRMTLGLATGIGFRYFRWVRDFLWADSVVVQEALLLAPLLYVKDLGKRRRVVFDFSDPVDRQPPGLKGWLRSIGFDMMVRHADVVLVENRMYCEALRGKARHVAHFYGPIDAGRYGAARAALPDRPQERPVRIGWTGSPGTYSFISPLMPIIDRIARNHAIELVLIGVDKIDHAFRHATLRLEPWDEKREFTTVPTFDLGLFRLEDTEDALWRGAGKLFIYMASGVPFIATARGISQSLMRESQLGFPVGNDADWETVLGQVIADRYRRISVADASPGWALDHLSYERYRQEMSAHLAPDPTEPNG